MGLSDRNSPPVQLPGRRFLRAFRFDPMSTRLGGRFLTLDVPFEERLKPGPSGDLVQVVDFDAAREVWYGPVDLNDPAILAQSGLRPSERDPRTHQQVVYAVAMSVIERFERFGGRRFRWRGGRQLRLVPHAFEGRNAFFDPTRRAVLFGYYRADSRDPGANLPGQVMFTCLSVDVVAHEVTHAVVHRLRKYFSEPTNPDVYAWHEAFADLVALFNHFAFPDVVAEAVAASRGQLREASALLDLAREFGESTGRGEALRKAIGSPRTPKAFLTATEPHQRGACFVAAVFDSYLDSYRSQIADLQRLATGGTGVLPAGALPPDLVNRVTGEALKNADRFLGMVVRAFDYLPVVDVRFGDVLRAIVTADRGLYPDDDLQLRAVLVEALRQRGIYPPRVSSLADDALVWPCPVTELSLTAGPKGVKLAGLILASTQDLDVAGEASAGTDTNGQDEVGAPVQKGRSRAGKSIGFWFQRWALDHLHELGLAPTAPVELVGVHVAYLQAADRQPRPVVVAQLAQRREDLEDQDLDRGKRPVIRAGTTVIARVDGHVDYLVTKPLPLTNLSVLDDLPEPIRAFAMSCHQEGQRRLTDLQAFCEQVESADALSVWTDQPAVQRLTFARLHADQSQVGV